MMGYASWTRARKDKEVFGGPRRNGGVFIANRRGTATIEFAITFPFLFALLLGMAQWYFYTDALRRVQNAAQLTADIITQQTQVGTGTSTATSLSSIFSATTFMLEPMQPLTTLTANTKIDAASIVYAVPGSNNNLSCTPIAGCTGIDWEVTNGTGASKSASSTNVFKNFSSGCALGNLTACYCTLDPATISTSPSCILNQSVIYVRVDYLYSAPVSVSYTTMGTIPIPHVVFGATQTITATAFLKPRLESFVELCTSSASTSCA